MGKAYHDDELKRINKQIADLQKAQHNLLQCWTEHPGIFADRLGWLLNGTYGYGAMVLALRVADNKRLNRMAGLSQLLAAVEWQCTQACTRSAWHKLTTAQQDNLNTLVAAELEYFDNNREEFEPCS